jgi:hypothetical protein
MLTEVLRDHWNSCRSIIPTYVPASSTGGAREVTPSVLKAMILTGRHSPGSERELGMGVSKSSNSISSSGSENDPRRSPLSTTALAVDAGRLVTSSDPHYTGGDSSASVTMADIASDLLIPENNVSFYGYSTLGHGFQYPPASVPATGQNDCTPTGSFTRPNSSSSATLGDLRVTYERADECTPSVSLSTPLLDNISFSPFMNFTPESAIRPSQSRPMFGERGGPGMKPYVMSAVPIARHTAHEDIFSFTQNANPSTAENTVLGTTMGSALDSNVGWLDDAFLYDLVAE